MHRSLTTDMIRNIFFFILVLISQVALADSGHVEHDHEVEFDAKETIIHHILDAHDWHLWDTQSDNGEVHSVSIPLPIILFTDGNLDVFMSSAFNHGHSKVVKGDREYELDHDHIIETSGKSVVDLSITKNAATLMIAAIILLLLFTAVARNYKNGNLLPKGLTGFMEPLIVFVKEEIAIPNIGEKHYRKFTPYLLSLFFFIWLLNLLGLIPFFPGGANVTGNVAVTLVLAVFTMILVNVNGNSGYWKHIFAPPGVPLWMYPIIVPVEIVGVISKPFALMVRLFANITAGHIVILSLISLIFIFKTAWASVAAIPMALFISVLELLVAALQAYIFTLLTALFIGLAVQEEHH